MTKITELNTAYYIFSDGSWSFDFYGQANTISLSSDADGQVKWTSFKIRTGYTKLPCLVKHPCTGECSSEEELFQMSVAWDYSIELELLEAIQKYCYIQLLDNFSQYNNGEQKLIELEY